MQVIILAGGLAERMRPLADRLPKSLFPVAGRAFLEWQLERLWAGGATRALLCVGHRGDDVRAHVARSCPPVPVDFCDDGARPLGTGGALAAAVARGLTDERFVVTYGDSYLPIDLRPLVAAHLAAGTPATMAVYANGDRWDRSNAVVADQRVLRYAKSLDAAARPAAMRHIDYGLSIFERSEVAAWRAPLPLDLAAPLGRLADAGQLAAYEVRERFYEIGSPSGLAELEQLLGDGAAVRS